LKLGINMFGPFKKEFLDWKSYKKKIDFLDNFYFQQNTRKESVKNL